jgi:hypothetical protein
MKARQCVTMIGMLGKQRAPAARDGRVKSHLARNLRFPVSAGPFMAERISEVLDGSASDILEKSSVFRDFPPDCRCGRLRQVAMSHGVAADRHQRVTREFAELILTECFAVDQRPAINPALRNYFAQMRQKTKVLKARFLLERSPHSTLN